jgi:hypothetical protein
MHLVLAPFLFPYAGNPPPEGLARGTPLRNEFMLIAISAGAGSPIRSQDVETISIVSANHPCLSALRSNFGKRSSTIGVADVQYIDAPVQVLDRKANGAAERDSTLNVTIPRSPSRKTISLSSPVSGSLSSLRNPVALALGFTSLGKASAIPRRCPSECSAPMKGSGIIAK